jgi:tricorn protease
LTLRRDGADRRVVVVPLASEHTVRYYDLVARQRTAVCEASGARLGYLKIPNMMAQGWADFHRDLYTEFQRDGLIVDLRTRRAATPVSWRPRSSPGTSSAGTCPGMRSP